MKNLYKALAGFQQEVPAIYKGVSGYGYKYASLEDIIKTINPYLSKHKLGFIQQIIGSNLKTTIFHTESGENMESLAEIPEGVKLKGMNDFQVAGAAITYFRRYSLECVLGLATTEDIDAAGEQEPKPKYMSKADFAKALAYAAESAANRDKVLAGRGNVLSPEQKAQLNKMH